MSIQCELGNDPQRGAGYGLLQIRGAGPVQGPVRFSLMRNQGTTPYLGPGGLWQATEFWHPVGETAREGETLTLPLGPDIIDPLVALPSTVAFRLTLAGGETRSAATLRVSRPLLGTGALAPRASPAASPPPEPPEPLPPPAPVSEPPQPLPAPPPETAATPPAPRRRAFWAGAAVLVLALAGIGLFAYLRCLLPGIQPEACQAKPDTTGPAESGTPPSPPPDPVAPKPSSCADLGADECLALAEGALQAGELENARQLYQDAARLGAVKANIRLARMYDPDHWSRESSPAERADWETAAYWYEEAARTGDPEGLSGAGRLLCDQAGTAFERARGLAFLREAVQRGGAEVSEQLLRACEESR